jgi:hypothetical protein
MVSDVVASTRHPHLAFFDIGVGIAFSPSQLHSPRLAF